MSLKENCSCICPQQSFPRFPQMYRYQKPMSFFIKKNDENFKHNKYDIYSSERPKSFCYVNLIMLCVK